jgi:1-acyl-sn-glycerol-3-phosphate acyltransferase
MYERWFRVEWEGLEHIPEEGGALLVSNHAGAIPSDAPAIMHGIETELGRPVYGLAEHLFKAMPVLGTLWSRTGGVAAHPDNAYRLLHDEQQLALVFPEGTKGTGKHVSDRYRLARFGRGGFVAIAMRAGVPVIPIAVVGAEESMPILWSSRRLAKILNVPYVPLTANMLVFGPLGLLGYVPPGEDRYSRARVMEASESIRGQIQEALYDMLRKRRSIWFG